MSVLHLLLAFLPIVLRGTAPKPEIDTFAMTPSQFWRTAFGENPWHALAGDADGDGHADLLAIGPGDESRVEMARTSPFGKATNSNVARNSMGKGLVAAACAPLLPGSKTADVIAIFDNGSVRMVWSMEPGTNTYRRDDLLLTLDKNLIPKGPARAVVADFDGDGRPDVLVLGNDGQLLLLQSVATKDALPHFTPRPLASSLDGVLQFAAGNFGEDNIGRCVWLDKTGEVWTASLNLKKGTLGLKRLLTRASREDHIAVGHFRGGKSADILVSQFLFTSGDPERSVQIPGIPPLAVTKTDTVWMAADFDGNGKDDLIRHRHSTERFGADDVYVSFSYDSKDSARGYYCSGNDGLPDIWKTGQVKPAGMDLSLLGCQVGHHDIVIEIERFENEPLDRLQSNLARDAQYFASLPIPNADGTTGIALHFIYRNPWPLSRKDEIMGDFDGHFPPVEHRGIVHSVFMQSGGPLVSAINGIRGHSNEGWREFLHEFGHQLGLVHDGYYPSWSPGFGNDTGSVLYPSLMSYTYSYAVNDNGDAIGYSDGSLASYPANQRHLSEKLPFPIAKTHFLGAGPYHFKIKASPDGRSTLVDWNWNGIFGEDDVAANLMYSHGVDFGPAYFVAKTTYAPVLVAHVAGGALRPLLVYGSNNVLGARSWYGANRDTEGDRWNAEIADLGAGITGDPSAAYLGNETTWVAYPTAKGAMLRSITISDGGLIQFGEPTLIPNTIGAQTTLVSLDGRLALFLWRNKLTPVGMSILRPNGKGLLMSAEHPTDVFSEVPVGATAGPVTPEGASIWIGRIQIDGQPNGGQTEVVRYVLTPGGSMVPAYRSWVAGTYSRHRMTLLWRPEAGLLPEGRLYLLSGGTQQDQWITMNVPYPDVSGGWLLRRYHSPGFTSASAPGACFFQDDIVYAYRQTDNALRVAFYGSGATPRPMGDFDDIGYIRDYGLNHSLGSLVK